eukprot:6273341-Prymnesium_polylepis.1
MAPSAPVFVRGAQPSRHDALLRPISCDGPDGRHGGSGRNGRNGRNEWRMTEYGNGVVRVFEAVNEYVNEAKVPAAAT